MKAIVLAVLGVAMSSVASADNKLQSFLPPTDIGVFLSRQLDLASFRNSLGPKRSSTQRTFAALGIEPTKVTENGAEFDSDYWYYSIQVLRRADLNGDGIEDLELCFTDQAKHGTYLSQEPLLVTRYSASGLVVALHFQVDGCADYAK